MKMSGFFVFFSLVWAVSIAALPERGVSQRVLGILEAAGEVPSGRFRGQQGLSITYMQFGDDRGDRGAVVVSPGNGESSIRYTELAMDLSAEGYSPVYVIDHRGQGFSERLLQDPQKSHVNEFENYGKDLKTFIDSKVVPHLDGRPLFLVAHSMGGAIAADYLERHPENPVRAAVLLSPMMMIFDQEGRSESELLRRLKFGCWFGKCNDYIPGGGPYKMREFYENNTSTSSPDRFAIKHVLRAKYEDVQLGSTTLRWVKESIEAIIKIRSRAHKLKTPTLLLQASEDRVVDDRGQNEFCQGTPLCTLVRIEGAKHGLHLERDELRDRVMEQIFNHLR